MADRINGEKCYFALRTGEGEDSIWSFPFTEVQPGESDEEALSRLTEEELGVYCEPGDYLLEAETGSRKERKRGEGALLCFYTLDYVNGEAAPEDADGCDWLSSSELEKVRWAEGHDRAAKALRKEAKEARSRKIELPQIEVDREALKEGAAKAVNKQIDLLGKAAVMLKGGAGKAAGGAVRAKQQMDLARLSPVFPGEFRAEDYAVPKLIRIVDYDKRMENPVCDGAIGFEHNYGGMRVLTLYEREAGSLGLRFTPGLQEPFYHSHPYRKGVYIDLDDYFTVLRKERVAELEHIAHSLGAKHVRITIKEETSSFVSKSAKGEIRGGGKPLGKKKTALKGASGGAGKAGAGGSSAGVAGAGGAAAGMAGSASGAVGAAGSTAAGAGIPAAGGVGGKGGLFRVMADAFNTGYASVSVGAKTDYSEKTFTNFSIVSEASFEGSDKPVRPELHFYENEQDILNLIEMRMTDTNAIKSKTLTMKYSARSDLSTREAGKIDGALRALKAAGNASLTSAAEQQNRLYLEYEIEF